MILKKMIIHLIKKFVIEIVVEDIKKNGKINDAFMDASLRGRLYI